MKPSESLDYLLDLSTLITTKAFAAMDSEEFADIPEIEKDIWVITTTINCDLCRLLVFLESCDVGAAKLLTMADLASKIYEAQLWYWQEGRKALLQIATNKPCGSEYVEETLRQLKSKQPHSKIIENYGIYRNKFGFHYDRQAPRYIYMFSNEDTKAFYETLKTFMLYSMQWTMLVALVLNNRITHDSPFKDK